MARGSGLPAWARRAILSEENSRWILASARSGSRSQVAATTCESTGSSLSWIP